jgi:hypothetical protein
MSELPGISEEITDSIFKEIESMNIILDNDPLEFGPKRLNSKVAEARSYLTRCEQLFTRVAQWLQLYKRAHRAGQLDFDLAMQDMLANDPEVRAGRNVKDRDAIATTKMRARREEIDQLGITIQDLEALMTVIKSKRIELRGVQGNLREQKQLCQEEIGLGSKWGSKAGVQPSGILNTTPSVDAITMKDINALLEGNSESDLSTVVVRQGLSLDKPVVVPSVEDTFKGSSMPQSEFDAYLDSVVIEPADKQVPKPSIDDLLDFL